MLLEVDGKVLVGKSDPNPLRCPNCKRFFPWKEEEESPVRCPQCAHQGDFSDFRTEFRELCLARVLAYL